MKASKIGAILIVVGVIIVIASRTAEQQERHEIYNQRMQYIEEHYPPGTYRGPEVAEYLFKPYPPAQASGFANLGIIIAGVGLFIILSKVVQEMK